MVKDVPSHHTSNSQTLVVALTSFWVVPLPACPCGGTYTWLTKNNLLHYKHCAIFGCGSTATAQPCMPPCAQGSPLFRWDGVIGRSNSPRCSRPFLWARLQTPPWWAGRGLCRSGCLLIGRCLKCQAHLDALNMHEPLNISNSNEVRHGKSVRGKARWKGWSCGWKGP